METVKEKRKKFEFPHTYVIIGIILVFVTVLTYIIPAGQYQRVEDADGQMVVLSDSFEFIEQTPVGPGGMVMAIVEGMVQSADIIFFIFFAYGLVYMLIETGEFFGGMGALIKKMRGKEWLIFPVFMALLGVCGSTFGLYEETYGLLPMFIGIGIAMGYDGLVGGAAVVLGVATGFAAATLNPFTIGIAQGIAQVPPGSGLVFRIVCLILFEGLAIGYLIFYARRVKADPARSIVKDVTFSMDEGMSREQMEALPFTARQKGIIGLFVLTIGILVYGTTQLGWYLPQLSALFLVMSFVVGLVGGYNLSQVCVFLVKASSEVIFGALAVGVARSMSIVMEQGNITDTVIYYLTNMLQGLPREVAAVGMVLVQNIINFFIPSGSANAAVTMPIMAPLADSVGLSRQIAVLAYQFGDGFSNIFWPTSVATECGLMGIPIQKWYKFVTPLFGMILALQIIMIVIATMINYS